MACKDETKEINGKQYYVVQLPPRTALLIKFKLLALLGPAAKELAKGVGAKKADQTEALLDGFVSLFKDVNPVELVALMQEVTETAKCDGKRIQFDKHFQGSLLEVYQVFFWVLTVNFSDFFTGELVQDFLSPTDKK